MNATKENKKTEENQLMIKELYDTYTKKRIVSLTWINTQHFYNMLLLLINYFWKHKIKKSTW